MEQQQLQQSGAATAGAAPPVEGARDLGDSQLVGVPAAVDGDVVMAERDGGGSVPNLEVAVGDGGATAVKRKRGRPAKGAPRASAAGAAARLQQKKEEEEEEDVCFICFDGGSLVLCDRRGCPKAYHPACIKRDEAFFRSKAKWNCGWHICSFCQKASQFLCYTCTYSVCKSCTKYADFVCVRENKGLCGICMRTIMLIENNGQGNTEKCEVDFDDKTSWEYLFKVYWMFLKGKISLTFDELLRAKNPWTGVSPLGGKVECPREIYNTKDDKGSGSENSCIDIESNNLKNKKSRRQPMLHSNGVGSDMITSAGDNCVPLPECSNWASKELLEFVAHMKSGDTSRLSQFDVQGLLLEYVKKNNLRDPQQKCQIVCDHRLLKLFGRARVGHIEMLKLLEPHFLTKENGPAEDTLRAGVTNTVASEGEAKDNCNKQLMLVDDKECKTDKKDDVHLPQNNPDVYAAINAHNINLIYLRRSLLENLTEDAESVRDKVVGSFVRIRITSSDKKQEMYRLVQVVGTSKAAEPYKIGTRTTDMMLEILNLNRKEAISIDEISNQEFSEDECKRLRQSIKYGLSNRLTVGEIMDKALTFQAMRVNDLLEAEILRLTHLRDRASEKGHRKELRECVEKLQLLNTPEERQRRMREIPEVHSDPNLDLMFESDEDAGESDERKQDGNIWSKYPGFDRKEKEPTLPKSCDSVLNDDGCRTQDFSAAAREQNGNACVTKSQIKPNETVFDDDPNVVVKSEPSGVALDISLSPQSVGVEQSFNDFVNDKSWHYQDPTGKVQGPFSMLQLFKWNASGGFPPNLRIWRINEKQDSSILLTDALSGKCSKNVSMPYFSQLLSLGISGTVDTKEDSKDYSQDGCSTAARNETHSDNQINEQNRELKVDDARTQSDGKDESVRSNGWQEQPHAYHPQPSVAISENMKENSDKLNEGNRIGGNSADKGNPGLNRTSDGQSNSGQSYQKQSYSEDNSGQSSEQNWRGPRVNNSSNCAVTTSAEVLVTKTSPPKLGFDLHSSPSHPDQNWIGPHVNTSSDCVVPTSAEVSVPKTSPPKLGFDLHIPPSQLEQDWRDPHVNTNSNCVVTTSAEVSVTKISPLKLGFDLHSPPSHPSWQAFIGETTDFSSLVDVDESVSDLLAEVEAMESLGGGGGGGGGGLESPTSIMKCGKGDALSSTGDLHLQSQSTAAEEPLRQADIHHHHHHHHHHQRVSGEHSSRSSEVKVGTKSISVSGYQWESGSENSTIGPSTATWSIATDPTWRVGSENTNLGWSGMDRGNVNIGWGVGQSAVQENRSTSSYTPTVSPSFGGSQARYGSDRPSVPRDRGFHGHGRESAVARGRTAWNRQTSFGVGNGGSHRPLPKGQRVCKFYESGRCKKGASCDYFHP
ncbi:hypothetical protein AAHE18_05G076800 [Arachis hypogaea]|uniref:Zinc finger CCCH domain-containing protein n=1 Tax=Arachis hypogaea TaxID=3818 RepID=A0A444WR86_ARAHY|nr:hypothetical protein Ahy_Scaffold1g106674 isoform C [Arachis hypogaea]